MIFFAPNEQARPLAWQLADQLKNYFLDIIWDVTNQAFVHEWYRSDQNKRIEPLTSVEQPPISLARNSHSFGTAPAR